MDNKNVSNLANILESLLNEKTLSSLDLKALNSNQYFNTIKHHGIALIEVCESNLTNTGRYKERSLHMETENVTRAENYLKKLHGI